MNKNIEKLYSIAQKPVRKIVGLMSGTSLDGLDIALCTIEGAGENTYVTLELFTTVAYSQEERIIIQKVCSNETVALKDVCLINAWLGKLHAEMLNNCLQQWNVANTSIDLIASHGQTIYHAPLNQHQQKSFGNATLQIGDADHIAVNTGIITVSDFRQKHVAAGGEGAPLAVYGDYLLFSDPQENVVLLNIGGIANITFLPQKKSTQTVFCSDTGPGNVLLNAYIHQIDASKEFDQDGTLSSTGTVNDALLNKLLEHPFFNSNFPKTTGRECFHLLWLNNILNSFENPLPQEDIMATLCAFTAKSISLAINLVKAHKVYVSGGGLYNTKIMQLLQQYLPSITFLSTVVKGVNPDAKEAILFALLANEAVAGKGYEIPNLPTVSLGKISFPL